MAELVDEPLGALCLLHDALLVVLPEGAAELVVVHGGAVLALAPEGGDAVGVDDLEDALLAVHPVDGGRVELRLQQQLLDELPQVDRGRRAAARG